MLKIYTASSWKNKRYPELVEMIRGWGHEVHDFRNPPEGTSGFQWEAIDKAWQTWSPEAYRRALSHPIAEAGYQSDKRGMDWADTCVLILPCGRSAHSEAGYMAGEGKAVFVLTQPGEEPELMYKLFDSPKTKSSRICVNIVDLKEKLEVHYGLRKMSEAAGTATPIPLKVTNGKAPPVTVPEMLRECANVYEQRAMIYGDNYKWFGKIMSAMFASGLTLQTADDWNRVGLLVQKVYKLTRYAQNFSDGGHDDSLVDDSVYSQMLREVDNEIKHLHEAML